MTTEAHGEKKCCHTNVLTGDVCGATIAATYGRFDCVECDFVLCQTCFYAYYDDFELYQPPNKRQKT